ncbi:MAG: universal stress protein [Bryobacteraceae bacterium]
MIRIRRILYFWSGERAEEQGLRRAWSLARTSGAELMVAGVWEKLPRDLLRMAPSQGLSRLAELAAAELRDPIRRAVDQLDGCPPMAQIKVLEGRMPQSLLEEVEAGGYDLLLLNAPRRGALRRVFSRDVPLMVIRACRVPVMVVRGGRWPRSGHILAAINAAASS